jgi:transcriptional regulator with XRE-family HTH domain
MSADMTKQLQVDLGLQVRALRLVRNQSQNELASQAGVALGALKRLENGSGATLRTLVSVAQALGRSEWLHELHTTTGPASRLRAGKPKPQKTPT